MSDQPIPLADCVILTPAGRKAYAVTARDLRNAETKIRNLEREVYTCPADGPCLLDSDGTGGRSTHCRRCLYHPLRKGDPAEAIARYLW